MSGAFLRLNVRKVYYHHLMQQIRGCMVSAGAVLASALGLAEGMRKISQDMRSMVLDKDLITDVEERQAVVSNMQKPATQLVDAALRAGAEMADVES